MAQMIMVKVNAHNSFTRELDNLLAEGYKDKKISLMSSGSFITIRLDTNIGSLFLNNEGKIRKITLYSDACFKIKKCFKREDVGIIKDLISSYLGKHISEI